MSYFRLGRHATLACTLAFAASSWAAPVVFQGTDLSPNGQVPGNGAAASARGQLTAQLAKAKKVSESFDGFAVGPSQTLTVGGGLATLTPLGTDPGWIENQSTNGRFDTSKGNGNGNGKWWETSNSFVVDFAQDISAFGFYGTDFADFGGTLTLELLADGVVANRIEIATKTQDDTPGQGNGNGNGQGKGKGKGQGNGKGNGKGNGNATIAAVPGAGSNGSLLFFGFNDDGGSYDAVRFVVGQGLGQEDYLGFDDFLFALAEPGDPGDPGEVPEPATLALTAVALAGAAAGRRRRPL